MSRQPRTDTAARPRSIRFSAAEWALVCAAAGAAGLSPGAYVRARALEG